VTDFAGLCRAARELPGPDTHDRLWAAWFALPAWQLIAAPSPAGPLPFSNYVDRQRCVMAFTTASRAGDYARYMRVGPLMPLAPDSAIQRVPQLKAYGVTGFLVDIGPDGFHTSLDNLWAMYHRFRAHPPAVLAPAPLGPVPGSVEWFLALPAWHVVVRETDRTVPELTQADTGADLLAQVYSSAQAVTRHAGAKTPTAVMLPAQALALFGDMELVRFVRFDGHLVADVLELRLRQA
jgi:hypothetical protein